MSETDDSGIVGRQGPLNHLGVALAASARGHRSVVLVSGEAGIGKTSLIRAAIGATSSDAVIGWGTGWHGEGAPGFWPWMQAFGDLVDGIGLEAARDAAGHDGDMLSVLVREFGTTWGTTEDPDRQRLLLLDGAVRWLEALTARRHVIVILDDLQWADSSTFDLLDHVLAAPKWARLLVIGAYRHDELADGARSRLVTLGSHADHVHLEGLTADGVTELVGIICGHDAARTLGPELHRRTGGHPLFVSELARLNDSDGTSGLPTVITGVVERRLGTLPDNTRHVLDLASVLGNRLLPDVLAAAAATTPADVVRHLVPAIDAGLVRSTTDDELWFTHDLFRETLYGQLDRMQRSALHGVIGDALEARNLRGASVSPGDLARHFAKASRSDDPGRSLRWATEAAADERKRSAFSEAAGHLRRARNAAADAGWTIEPASLVGLLMDEADSQARSGEPDTARDLLAQAARVTTDPALCADVALAVQRLGARFATPRQEIIGQLETALDAVTPLDLVRRAKLTAALARELQHSVAEDRARAGSLSEEALELGRGADDDTLVACLLARHDALWRPGTGTERARLGHEIAAVGGRLGDTDRMAEGLILQANGLLESGSAGFRPILDRWCGLLDARDEPRDRYMVTTRRAALALLEGDTEVAEALMHDAARIGERIHEPDTGNVLMSQRVALARARADPNELRMLADDAVRWWTGAPVLAHAVAAGAYTAAGELESAGREVAMVAASGGWRSEDSYLRSVLVTHLGEAAVALGDEALCRELFDDIVDLAEWCGVNGAVVAFVGPFAHTAGLLARELGDAVAAGTLLRTSVATARRLGAAAWVRDGEIALAASVANEPVDATTSDSSIDVASLTRKGSVWTVSWRAEYGNLPHMKGLGDIAILVGRPGRDIAALQLAVGSTSPAGSNETAIDRAALQAYQRRLAELESEIDDAADNADIGRVEHLEREREHLLAEVRRSAGLGGRLRVSANDPAERARKAVSARIRDAVRRIEMVAPLLGAHLDRCIHTGARCSYSPVGADAAIRWHVER